VYFAVLIENTQQHLSGVCLTHDGTGGQENDLSGTRDGRLYGKKQDGADKHS